MARATAAPFRPDTPISHKVIIETGSWDACCIKWQSASCRDDDASRILQFIPTNNLRKRIRIMGDSSKINTCVPALVVLDGDVIKGGIVIGLTAGVKIGVGFLIVPTLDSAGIASSLNSLTIKSRSASRRNDLMANSSKPSAKHFARVLSRSAHAVMAQIEREVSPLALSQARILFTHSSNPSQKNWHV